MSADYENEIRLVSFLGSSLPNTYGIMLFDLTRKDIPLITRHNAAKAMITEVRKFLKTAIAHDNVIENGMLLNRGIPIAVHKLAKLSVDIIKGNDSEPKLALCIAMDLNFYLEAASVLEGMTNLDTDELEEIVPESHAAKLPSEPSLDLIDEMVRGFTGDPERMTIDEKTELLIDLYETGVFALKGAVARAADATKMSEKSIYRYLAKIRRARGD